MDHRRVSNRRHGPARWLVGAMLLSAPLLMTLRSAALGQTPDDGTGKPVTEDDDLEGLIERLLEGSASDGDDDLMSQIVALMDEARLRLHRKFDPGPQTQAVQIAIIERLDDAIQLALLHRQKFHVASQDGDLRRMPDAPREEAPARGRAEQVNKNQGAAGGSPGGTESPTGTSPGAFKELRRGWGHLPPREREEIIQGVGETVLEGYRDLIDRYYRALAETREP